VTLVAYLGPEGTFTHQAALEWVGGESQAVAYDNVAGVHDAVASGAVDRGVVAIENSVEGYVMPSLDGLLASREVVAVGEVVLAISFDAFVRPDHGVLTEATAHPHGLAQVTRFVAAHGLWPVPAASNGAACRDVGAHQVAFGPRISGALHGLDTLAEAVEDFGGARTRFLVLARRDAAAQIVADARLAPGSDVASGWRTILAVTPAVTGPGVLARIMTAFGDRGINVTSLIERPLKARANQYVFIATCDTSPWQAHGLLEDLLTAGDSLKVLGTYPATGAGSLGGVLAAHVPHGSVAGGASAAELAKALLW
jgi:prephenate dehydratase/chorismate mutase/prephenate dehydratase